VNAMTGCTETTDGFHQIDWMDVPAQTWNAGSSGEFEAYGAHQRGQCQACEQTFSREKPAEFPTDQLREARRANARAHAERDHAAGNFRADAREVAELTTSADTREYWTFYAERIDQLERIAAREARETLTSVADANVAAILAVKAQRDEALAEVGRLEAGNASLYDRLRAARDHVREVKNERDAAHVLMAEAVSQLEQLDRTIARDGAHTIGVAARLSSQVALIRDTLLGK
jgi:hypothetical protein